MLLRKLLQFAVLRFYIIFFHCQVQHA